MPEYDDDGAEISSTKDNKLPKKAINNRLKERARGLEGGEAAAEAGNLMPFVRQQLVKAAEEARLERLKADSGKLAAEAAQEKNLDLKSREERAGGVSKPSKPKSKH